MAISKILTIGSCGTGYIGKHLKQAINYIKEPHKTGDGRWIGSINCQREQAYETMRHTKEQFGKTDKRQGYHMVISFVEEEVDVQTAFEVIGRFVKEYLGDGYEAVYAVHNNTEHIHGHIIYNSVSYRDGKKYRYKKGDWAKEIQPITNRLCEEYGLSTIEISDEQERTQEHYKEWNDYRDGKFVWANMIKRDINACILLANTYEDFLDRLSDMGYEIKNAFPSEGKYLAIKPMGLTRFKRCKSLGEEYSEESIRERIEKEQISSYKRSTRQNAPRIVRCHVKRYKRRKLSGIQKRYFRRLYRVGMLKKRPYSQVWKYCDDIRKMHKLQEDYLFLHRHQISQVGEVNVVKEFLEEKRKEVFREKGRVYREREKMKPLFDLVKEMKELQEMENCYVKGDSFFKEEHEMYLHLQKQLNQEGYSLEQVELLEEHYQGEVSKVCQKEAMVKKEERIAKRILAQILQEEVTKEMHNAKKDGNQHKKAVGQPVR